MFVDDPSVDGRTGDYGVVFSIVGDHPWLGRGLFTFLPRYYRILDNQVLMITLELGLVGLVVAMITYGTGFWSARRVRRTATTSERRHLGLALSGSIAGLALSLLTYDAWGYPMATGLAFVILGMAGAAWRLTHDGDPRSPYSSRTLAVRTRRTPVDGESVVVVVVTFNSAAVLPGLVESLPAGLGGLDWHLVVADNGSGDGSADVVRRRAPAATVLELVDNRGYAAGINAALSVAPEHTAVLVLNPDVRLDPGCVPALVDAMRRTGAGIVVPRLRDAQGELIFSMRRAPSLLRALGDALLGATRAGRVPLLGEVVTHPSAYAREAVIDWAEGSTQLVSAECWSRCAPWDESYFLYSEETDFHLRARDAGFEVRYVPTAGASHLEGGSATSVRLWPLLVANRFRLFRGRHGRIRSGLFWGALVLREGSRAAMGRPTSWAALAALTSPRRMRAARGPAWLEDAA